jgi:hypothetical protein
VAVDAKDLLRDDESAAWLSRRVGAVSRERESVGGFQFDGMAHARPP